MSETKRNQGGRPRVDATPVTVRLPAASLTLLDAWIGTLNEPLSRPAAIRVLLDLGLKASEASGVQEK
jgi:hypothetical protein